MLIEKDLKNVLNQLSNGSPITLRFDGVEISLQALDNASKLNLSTPVYYGGNYIPSSVRRCLSQKHFNQIPSISTFFTIDEVNYKIYLNHLEIIDILTDSRLRELLQNFSETADEWRYILDEHDKNDLIHVHTK